MNVIRKHAYARAGLIGNPTDGYNGKTISFVIRQFKASVVLYPWDRLEILWSQQDKNRFTSLEELVNDVNVNGYYGGVRLVKATIKRFAEYCAAQNIELQDQPFSIRYDTNIPRGVGLAGSSAIVVATLKSLISYYGVDIPREVQPSLARSVENEELGIACGYQDRAMQIYEGMLYMDFGNMQSTHGYDCGEYTPLQPATMPNIYVAYDVSAAKTSGSVHGPLRTRVTENEDLLNTMNEIAGLVPAARQALETNDTNQLHTLINRNFELRANLYSIKPSHKQMVDVARSCGASAKFAGSGGAIVGSFADKEMYDKLVKALANVNSYWQVLIPQIF
jgi:glucuronokinase